MTISEPETKVIWFKRLEKIDFVNRHIPLGKQTWRFDAHFFGKSSQYELCDDWTSEICDACSIIVTLLLTVFISKTVMQINLSCSFYSVCVPRACFYAWNVPQCDFKHLYFTFIQ
ncbi:hypothetical protein NL108_005501 [Boleophthalmus pectinirostris]|nr:hypothetical protein NL108_005501 [Boleophthalmus pectinirostris]